MRFDWDPGKSLCNLVERGFDFAFATLIFDGPTLERVDDRQDYGEPRVIAIGRAGALELTVVYSDRSKGAKANTRRIISARRSSRQERRAYEAALKKS
ncbi:MAG: BrnT family toxin [Gemmatimonadaceae bacterium]